MHARDPSNSKPCSAGVVPLVLLAVVEVALLEVAVLLEVVVRLPLLLLMALRARVHPRLIRTYLHTSQSRDYAAVEPCSKSRGCD